MAIRYLFLSLLLIFVFPTNVSANLCKPQHLNARHTAEANQVSRQRYARGNYAGGQNYNRRVIGCNRHRDDNGRRINNALRRPYTLGNTLGTRLVKGHIKYFNAFKVRYGYAIRRNAGTWTVTVPVQFHFPKRFANRLDIPMDLAQNLGINTTLCATTRRRRGHIDVGYVDSGNGLRSKNACRVRRGNIYRGRQVTVQLMRYWQRKIQTYWSRPGFQVRIRIVNLNEIPANRLRAYKRKNIVWHIRMNHRKKSRATYKAVFGKPHPIYAGLPWEVIVHEFGHVLGLDDEYPEGKRFPAWRDCRNLGGRNYTMCVISWGAPQTDAKGVYPWIITRRYAIGSPL